MSFRPYLSTSGNQEVAILLSLQTSLLSTTSENIEEYTNQIKNSIFFTEDSHQKQFVHCVLNTVVYRPLNAENLAKLTKSVLQNSDFSICHIHDYLLRAIAMPSTCDLAQIHYYRLLLDLGVFTAEEIVREISNFYKEFPNAELNHLLLFAWFTPEIEQLNKEHFTNMLLLTTTSPQMQQQSDVLAGIVHFFTNFSQFRENNYELWRKCMNLNDEPDSLAHIIRNDDITYLQSLATAGTFDVNQRIPPFIFGISSFLAFYPTIIQYAAYVGAVKCFKYLLLNYSDLKLTDVCSTTIAQLAVAGGSLEIIRSLEDKVNFDGCLSVSARFIQNNVFQWLHETKFSDLGKADLNDLSPIHYAVESGNIPALLTCLDNGVDVNAGFDAGWTPLHIAAKHGQSSMIRILSSHEKININPRDARGWTPLHWAANNCHPNTIRLILQSHRADVNAADNEGQTALHWAALKGYKEIAKILLEQDEINVNVRNNDGSTPLHMAAMKGNTSVAELLVKHNGIDINIKDDSEATPLYLAAENGNVEVIEVLLQRFGVDVNATDNFKETPIFAAASSGNERKEETLKVLLKHPSININAVNSRGSTPLHIFAENGNKEAVRLLIERPELNINARDGFGWTPLHSASSVGNFDTIKELIEHSSIDPNAIDDSGKTALFWAVGSSMQQDTDTGDPVKAVELLLPITDVNIKNADGQTVLHYAMTCQNEKIIEDILNSNDINVNVQDNEGNTPLHIACQCQNERGVEMLLERKDVDISIVNSKKRTPIHVAALLGTQKIVRSLLDVNTIDINSRDYNGSTPLLLAVESGVPEKVQEFVNYKGIDLSAADNNGRSPRVNALRKGYAAIASILKKAHPN